MADKRTGPFETAVDRLDTIVRQLESGDVALDDAVALYREGRDLVQSCEQLLKAAQEAVETPPPPPPNGAPRSSSLPGL